MHPPVGASTMSSPPGPQASRLRTLIRWLLRLYPRAWRERYADEITLVLAAHRVTLWTALDMLLGALDARLHPDLLPGKVVSMAQRLRNSEVAVFCAVVLFCLAWLPLRLVRDPLSAWRAATVVHPELLTALTVLDVAGGIAVLAVAVGGAPILLSSVACAVRGRDARQLALFAIPLVTLAMLVAYSALAIPSSTARQSGVPEGPFTPLAVVLQLGLVALLLVTILGSTAAIAAAIGRSTLDIRLLRFALVPAGFAAGALVVGLLAAAGLTGLVFDEAPQLGSGPALHAADLLLMLAAATLALSALRRGFGVARDDGTRNDAP